MLLADYVNFQQTPLSTYDYCPTCALQLFGCLSRDKVSYSCVLRNTCVCVMLGNVARIILWKKSGEIGKKDEELVE